MKLYIYSIYNYNIKIIQDICTYQYWFDFIRYQVLSMIVDNCYIILRIHWSWGWALLCPENGLKKTCFPWNMKVLRLIRRMWTTKEFKLERETLFIELPGFYWVLRLVLALDLQTELISAKHPLHLYICPTRSMWTVRGTFITSLS